MTRITPKMVGDAGEHYALSQFTFAGRPATKMPDGWTGYDLAIVVGDRLDRVSVKTRTETASWKSASWFMFDERTECDWYVFIFKGKDGALRAWVMPSDVALANANVPTEGRKDRHIRDISWAKLIRNPLAAYENNWSLAAPS